MLGSQFTPLYNISAVLWHNFTLGVVFMNNNPSLLASYSLVGSCQLAQVVQARHSYITTSINRCCRLHAVKTCRQRQLSLPEGGEHKRFPFLKTQSYFCRVVRVRQFTPLYTIGSQMPLNKAYKPQEVNTSRALELKLLYQGSQAKKILKRQKRSIFF